MLVRVLYHDHCFDGAASAAFFSRFVAGSVHPDAEFAYTGMAHKASQSFDPELFDGDENAIVDFKYSNDPRLTWWFDHHQSAFLSPEDAQRYREEGSARKLYDPSFKSCASFIRKVACERFGFHAPDLEDLVDWSIIIDGAQYPDARSAVELAAPAMKLTLVIEAAKGSEIVRKVIRWMQSSSLNEIVGQPEIQALYKPLYQRHVDSIEIIRKSSEEDRGVVFFDLAGHDMEGYNKFIPYFLFPDSTYIRLVKERAYLQSRVVLAQTDSIYLTINLADSIMNLEISGVIVHRARIGSFSTSGILTGNENIVSAMLAAPLTIASALATIKKEPVMIKMAPKDTTEYKPDIMPDTSITEPVNYILVMTNGTRIYVYQIENNKRSERMAQFKFDLNDRLHQTWDALRRVVVFKVPEYHPFIKIKLPRSDAKIIYRAIPKNGQIAVFL